MKQVFFRIALLLTFVFSWTAARAEMDREQMTEKLTKELSTVTTPDDSVRILLDLFDINNVVVGEKYVRQVLDIAIRTNNSDLGFDMIRHLAFVNVLNDSVLVRLERDCMKFPNSENRKMTMTYLSLRRAGNAARYSSSDERLERTRKAISDGYFNRSADIYDKIRTYGSISILLGNAVHRGLLTVYLKRTLDLLPLLPEQDYSIRNLIYLNAADLYTKLEMHEEAVEINLKRLELLDRMIDNTRKSGRKHFNFDLTKSLIFQSLIQNYEALTLDEVNKYYAEYLKVVPKASESQREVSGRMTNAYYLMANGRFEEAIPMLKLISEETLDRFVKRETIGELIKAAKAVGDKETLLEATQSYNEMLQKYLDQNAQETYSELQILYDVNDMREKSAAQQVKDAEDRTSMHLQLLTFGLIFVILLLTALTLLLFSARRSRHLADELKKSNEALKHESEDLRKVHQNLVEARDKAVKAERHKSEFINNITHELNTPLETIVEYSQLIADCTDSSRKRYLQNYADIVRLNAELFRTFVRDMLDIGSLENKTFSVTPRPCSLNDICQMAFNSAAHHVKPGVNYSYIKGDIHDAIMVTDSKRVEQVLINLLNNAAKFTEKGSIKLSYTINTDANTVTFAVTDTGCGIPPEMSEQIFRRFVKLDKQMQGVGLGLAISRLIAQLLHGSLTLDTSYTEGSRFLFTIPML